MNPPEPATLENCAQEPIHIPGSIQPHGALLQLDAAGKVVAYSANLVGEEASRWLPAGIHSAVGLEARELGLDLASYDDLQSREERSGVASWSDDLEVRVHRNPDGHLLVEIEPVGAQLPIRTLRDVVARLQACSDIDSLCLTAADQYQRLLGFDRVMVYRFDTDGHGEVVAEATSDVAERRFLGQHFPEGDIPAQARRLYTRQPSRLIADVLAHPVPLLSDSFEPLDLSDTVLRSVSPIHCEYLTNMGVRASQSFSLIVQGELFGLVACHHYSPIALSPHQRSAAILALDVLNGRLAELSAARREQARESARQRLQPMLAMVEGADATLDGLASALGEVATLLSAEGAILRSRGKTVRTLGTVPGEPILNRIDELVATPVFVTDRLGERIPEATRDPSTVCGVLKLAIDNAGTHLTVFREEAVFQRPYGHRPAKERLSPAGSFELFLTEVRGHSRPWTPHDLALAERLCQEITGVQARLAARLERRNQELLAASEAKDDFLAMLSHELRNPLNAVLGWAKLLQTGRVPGERLVEAHDAIHRNAVSQQRLIDDLLDVTRIANGKIELHMDAVNLEDCVDSAVAATQQAFDERQVQLRVIRSSTNVIEGDFDRIKQVCWNLLGNAAKYSEPGGKVYARVYPRGSWIIFEVEDEGIGIPSEELPHLFDRFYRSSALSKQSNPGGLGLGLSIVHGLTELHGGRVEVESERGKGSTFRVLFPVASNNHPKSRREAPPNDGGIDLHGVRAVVIDDQTDASGFLKIVLAQSGAEVQTFADPSEALAHLASEAQVDVLISDIHMEPFDGYELARRVRTLPHRATLPMIAVTAYAAGRDRIRAYRAGFGAHVAKPVDTEEFLAVIAANTSFK